MQDYVTIKQASKLTEKHTDTIRRLVKANKSNRQYIVTNTSGQYLIKKDWLLQQYGIEVENEPNRAPVSEDIKTAEYSGGFEHKSSTSALYEALVEQLSAKDKQIEQLQQIILEKEANTTKLQDQFQQLLATQQLPARVTPTPQEELKQQKVVAVDIKPKQTKVTKASTAGKKRSTSKPVKNVQGKTEVKKKRRWFNR